MSFGIWRHTTSRSWITSVRSNQLQYQRLGAKSLGHPFENIAYLTVHFDGRMIAHFHVNWLAPVKVRKTLVGGTKKTIVYDDMEPIEKVRMYDSASWLDRSKGHTPAGTLQRRACSPRFWTRRKL